MAFRRIGLKILARHFLALDVGDQALVEEQVGERDSFLRIAHRAVAQIEHDALGSLLLQGADCRRNFFHLTGDQSLRPDITDLIGHHLRTHGRIHNRGSRQNDLLRIGLAALEDGNLDRRTGIAPKNHLGKSERHVARGHTFDRLDEVARRHSRLGRRGVRQGADNADVPRPLGERQADVAFVQIPSS